MLILGRQTIQSRLLSYVKIVCARQTFRIRHAVIKADSSIFGSLRERFQSTFKQMVKLFLTPTILQISFLSPKDISTKDKIKIEETINRADRLYDDQQYEQLYSLLHEHRHSDNEEILWRLGRAMFQISQTTQDRKKKFELVEEGLQHVQKALQLDENNGYCHKWYGILLESVSGLKGTKEKIEHGLDIYNHFKRATELVPFDPNSHYLLGYWCFTVADLTWYEKKLASIIYGDTPTSTFEEAICHFEKAETVQPNFYSMNLLLLGKCYIKTKNKEKATFYLQKTVDYPQKTDEDREAQKEAMKLLKKLK